MAVFLNDTFTDTDTTLLPSHTPDTGGTWVKIGGDGSNHFRVLGNALYADGSAGAEYYNDEIAPAADVNVTLLIDAISDENVFMEFGARFTTGGTTDDAVTCAYDEFSNVIRLTEYVNGTDNELDTPVALTRADQELRLEIIGTAAKVYKDDVEILSGTTAVTAAGYVGLTKFGNSETSVRFTSIVGETIEEEGGPSQRFMWMP